MMSIQSSIAACRRKDIFPKAFFAFWSVWIRRVFRDDEHGDAAHNKVQNQADQTHSDDIFATVGQQGNPLKSSRKETLVINRHPKRSANQTNALSLRCLTDSPGCSRRTQILCHIIGGRFYRFFGLPATPASFYCRFPLCVPSSRFAALKVLSSPIMYCSFLFVKLCHKALFSTFICATLFVSSNDKSSLDYMRHPCQTCCESLKSEIKRDSSHALS